MKLSAKLGVGFLVAGCDGPLSTLAPAGPAAAGIAALWWVMFWGGLAIFLAVLVLFLSAWLRPGSLRGVPAKWWIIGGGLALPLPVIALLTVAALMLGEGLRGNPTYRIEADARMWEWHFTHPDGTVDVNAFRFPANEDVEIIVTSRDVIHSFWIPRLGGKIDAIPGHENTIVLRADRPGEYAGINAEYSGVGHKDMTFTATATEPE